MWLNLKNTEQKKPSYKCMFHQYEVLEQAKPIYNNKKQISACLRATDRKELTAKKHQSTSWGDGKVLHFDLVAQMYTSVKIHQTAC